MLLPLPHSLRNAKYIHMLERSLLDKIVHYLLLVPITSTKGGRDSLLSGIPTTSYCPRKPGIQATDLETYGELDGRRGGDHPGGRETPRQSPPVYGWLICNDLPGNPSPDDPRETSFSGSFPGLT